MADQKESRYHMMKLKLITPIACAALLAACSGGNSDSSDVIVPDKVTTPDPSITVTVDPDTNIELKKYYQVGEEHDLNYATGYYAPYSESKIVKIADDRENEVFIFYPVKDGVEEAPIIMSSGNFVKWLDTSNPERGTTAWDDISTTNKLYTGGDKGYYAYTRRSDVGEKFYFDWTIMSAQGDAGAIVMTKQVVLDETGQNVVATGYTTEAGDVDVDLSTYPQQIDHVAVLEMIDANGKFYRGDGAVSLDLSDLSGTFGSSSMKQIGGDNTGTAVVDGNIIVHGGTGLLYGDVDVSIDGVDQAKGGMVGNISNGGNASGGQFYGDTYSGYFAASD